MLFFYHFHYPRPQPSLKPGQAWWRTLTWGLALRMGARVLLNKQHEQRWRHTAAWALGATCCRPVAGGDAHTLCVRDVSVRSVRAWRVCVCACLLRPFTVRGALGDRGDQRGLNNARLRSHLAQILASYCSRKSASACKNLAQLLATPLFPEVLAANVTVMIASSFVHLYGADLVG